MITLGANTPPNLTSFYGAFTPVCFTLLGLWLIVVQTRHSEWRRSAVQRSRAYTLSANFALPGLMALLSLVDPGNSSLWRAAFACVALGGLLMLVGMLFRGAGGRKLPLVSMVTTGFAAVIYGLVAVVALAPHTVSRVGIELRPLECEAILLSVLVFVTVNVAWFLMFDEAEFDR